MTPRLKSSNVASNVEPVQVAFLCRSFRGGRPSDGSGGAAAAMLAGLGNGAESYFAYHPSTPAPVVLLLQSSTARHFRPVEALRNGLATPECDCWPLLVEPRLRCSLLSRPLADLGPPAAAFDMLHN